MCRAQTGLTKASSSSPREGLLTAASSIYHHLRLFGLLMHVGSAGKKSKTEAMYCPARDEDYNDGDTSDLVLACGGTVSFTQSFVYLGSLLHRDLSDHHDVERRIKKASAAFGVLRDRFFGSKDVPERLKGQVYTGGVLAILLYGCESWCLTAASIQRLSLWHNKRIREIDLLPCSHVPIVRSPHLFQEPSAAHRGIRARALSRKPHAALGGPRCSHAQDTPSETAPSLMDRSPSHCRRPRNELR